MAEVPVTIEYDLGHTHDETWEETDLHCPRCGSESVWEEKGPGDYYVGPGMVCTDCECAFTMQGPNDADYTKEQVIEQIREQGDDDDA